MPHHPVVSLMCLALLATLADAAERPNVIFMMADDMGLGDVHAYDASSTIPTPNMDRLARQGMRFTDAHSPASVCTPSRYSVLTGRYPFRSRLQDQVLRSAYDAPLLDQRHETVAGLLRRSGYRTAAFGKWHLGMTWTNRSGDGPAQPGVGTSHFTTMDVDFRQPILDGPRQHGFDYFFGIGSSINHGPYAFIENDRVTEIPDRMRPAKPINGKAFREGWVAPSWDDSQQGAVISGKAIAFLRAHAAARPEQPFFMYYAATANHWPHVPPATLAGQPVQGRGGNDDGAPERNDMVVQNDVILGLLLDALEDPNGDGDTSDSLAEDTLVILTSDNGADVGSYRPVRGKKASIYEGGHRVPLIARWPRRIPAGATCAEPVSLIDLYATLAALLDAEPLPRAAIDSQNVLPLFSDAPAQRRTILHQKDGAAKIFAVRKGRWKLIIHDGAPAELYDLRRDLREQHDVLSREPAVVERLMAQFQQISHEPGPAVERAK